MTSTHGAPLAQAAHLLPGLDTGVWTKLRFNPYKEDLTDASPLSTDTPRHLPDGFSSQKRSGNRPRIMSRTMPQRQHMHRLALRLRLL